MGNNEIYKYKKQKIENINIVTDTDRTTINTNYKTIGIQLLYIL